MRLSDGTRALSGPITPETNDVAFFEYFVEQKFNGASAAGGIITNFDYIFTAGCFFTANTAENIVDSRQNFNARVQEVSIVFRLENFMGMDSLLEGWSVKNRFGFEGYVEVESSLKMIITCEFPYATNK